MQEEGPSGGQDTDFTLIDVDVSSPNSKLREIIQEQKTEISTLTEKLQRAQWVINYLEQWNKQLEDHQTIMELQNILTPLIFQLKRLISTEFVQDYMARKAVET